jgi:hypothetical protein
MRNVLIALLAAVTLGSGIAPAFAATNAQCDAVPRSEWARCIFDQAAESAG